MSSHHSNCRQRVEIPFIISTEEMDGNVGRRGEHTCGNTQEDVGGSHELPCGANDERWEKTGGGEMPRSSAGGSGEFGRWRSWSSRTRKNMDDDIRLGFLSSSIICVKPNITILERKSHPRSLMVLMIVWRIYMDILSGGLAFRVRDTRREGRKKIR